MKSKKIALCITMPLSIGSQLICHDDNADKHYIYTEKQAKKEIKESVKKKFGKPGMFYGYYYDDEQSRKDAEKICKKVKKECIKNARNFKRVMVKRWHEKRTTADAELRVEDAIKANAIARIKEIFPHYSSMALAIATQIMRGYRDGREKEFIGNRLTSKIKKQIRLIEKQRRPKKFEAARDGLKQAEKKKRFPTQDCPICMETFDGTRDRLYIKPCGHNICPECFARYNEICSLCRGKVQETERESIPSAPEF
jgi:hypothetical protein